MTANPLLSTFPPPLARLILCGGGGLTEAWLPMIRNGGRLHAWNPETRLAFSPDGRDFTPLQCPDRWTLPLSHWRPRLALVAAWMLFPEQRPRIVHADVTIEDRNLILSVVFQAAFNGHRTRGHVAFDVFWTVKGDSLTSERLPDLPTLPTHLRAHDPSVALLLALYDVPEIRARVEAL